MSARLPGWHWWSVPADYTLTVIADVVLTWLFARLVIANIVKRD